MAIGKPAAHTLSRRAQRAIDRAAQAKFSVDLPYQNWPQHQHLADNMIVVNYDPVTRKSYDQAGNPVNIHVTHQQARYAFEGGHVSVGAVHLTRLAQLPLSKNQLRVAIWLISIMRRNNYVAVSGAMAEHALSIERHLFSRIMTSMVDLDILRKEARSLWIMNPKFAWNGKALDHKPAIQDWERRKDVVVEFARAEGLEKMIA